MFKGIEESKTLFGLVIVRISGGKLIRFLTKKIKLISKKTCKNAICVQC